MNGRSDGQQPRADFYDMAGIMSTSAGTLLSTHVGDDLALYGFAEGANPPDASDGLDRASAHPVYGPSTQLIGIVALVALILYMDHRIKVRLPAVRVS